MYQNIVDHIFLVCLSPCRILIFVLNHLHHKEWSGSLHTPEYILDYYNLYTFVSSSTIHKMGIENLPDVFFIPHFCVALIKIGSSILRCESTHLYCFASKLSASAIISGIIRVSSQATAGKTLKLLSGYLYEDFKAIYSFDIRISIQY